MIRRFSVSVGGRVLAAALQIFVVALTARALGVEDFATFASASSLTLVVLAIFDMGAGVRVLRILNDPAAGGTLATLSLIRLILFVLLPVVGYVLAGQSGGPGFLVVAACVYVIGESLGDLLIGILQGMKRSAAAMATLIVRRLLPLGVLIALPTPSGALIASATAGLLGCGLFLMLSWRLWRRPRNPLSIVKENLTIIASGGAANLAQLDVPLVTLAAGPTTGGLYAAAVRLFNPVNILVSTLMQVVVPELAGITDGESRLAAFKNARRTVTFLAIALAICSPLAPFLLSTLYGAEYAGGALVAVAVFLAASASAVAQVYMAWFYATRVPPSVPVAMISATLVGLLVITILSPLGVPGAAAALLLMHIGAAFAIVTPWHLNRRRDCAA